MRQSPSIISAPPGDGVYLYGLVFVAGLWSHETQELVPSDPATPISSAPVLHFKPEVLVPSTSHRIGMPAVSAAAEVRKKGESRHSYSCPIHANRETQNPFAVVELPTAEDSIAWTLRGTMLVCSDSMRFWQVP